ncbi:MAG: hypothetical protein ABIR32_15205 [Ilumatobacteraceae bacterium]
MQFSQNSTIHHRSTIVAVIVFALVAAACGSDDGSAAVNSTLPATAVVTTETPTTEAQTAEAPPTTGGAVSTAPVVGDATVETADTDLGTILVDGEGRTLYMFAPDSQGPSTCEDKCLATWPSLTGPATAGDGVDAALLGTVPRSDDRSEQVTYDGWPLYHFAKDAAPGDINGQGVGDVWYVVDPSGAPIGMAVG